MAGQDGVFTPTELRAWSEIAQRLARADDSTMRRVLGSARRFPPRRLDYPVGLESSGMPATLMKPGSDVDRPDAFLALYGLFNAPRTRALLRAGLGVLGTVVRDREAVWDALVKLPAGEHAARRAFVVAAGLLGQPSPLHLLGDAWHQPEDMAAWGLAQALALGPGETGLLQQVLAEETSSFGTGVAGEKVLRQMRQRLASGHFFSALG